MKILAVIPARAGSKGIPNKNIRILNGKPLIWYSINNAKKSRFITDIIVTSDSPEIELIARQMCVTYLKRDEALCGDNVTLDDVVYDAAKDVECDVVVTMQPTSPTLTTETLDAAIEFFIDEDLDTLISAVNAPRLSWSRDGESVKPNYISRVNRQYLPADYAEMGAFLISKKSVTTQHSRIGERVEVYEIPNEEAVDIDNFSELLFAQMVLEKKSVAIYVNGNRNIGMGHICRSLELADEFYCKPDILYNSKTTDRRLFGETTHNLISIDNLDELVGIVREKRYGIFINDILETTSEYIDKLKAASPDMKVINFEDEGTGIYKADAVINALYHEANLNNMYVGEKYYIAPKKFLFYSPITINEEVKNVFISFGGADPLNYTERLLNIVSKEKYKNIGFTVAVGRAYSPIENISKFSRYPNINILYDVVNMPELMSGCDIAVTSRGRTGYELALLGIPTISMAQNQREEKHKFICAENGFIYIGRNPSDTLIEANLQLLLHSSKVDREQLQGRMLSCDLKNGRKRVMSLIDCI